MKGGGGECVFFTPHPIFGFAKCAGCGKSKKSHPYGKDEENQRPVVVEEQAKKEDPKKEEEEQSMGRSREISLPPPPPRPSSEKTSDERKNDAVTNSNVEEKVVEKSREIRAVSVSSESDDDLPPPPPPPSDETKKVEINGKLEEVEEEKVDEESTSAAIIASTEELSLPLPLSLSSPPATEKAITVVEEDKKAQETAKDEINSSSSKNDVDTVADIVVVAPTVDVVDDNTVVVDTIVVPSPSPAPAPAVVVQTEDDEFPPPPSRPLPPPPAAATKEQVVPASQMTQRADDDAKIELLAALQIPKTEEQNPSDSPKRATTPVTPSRRFMMTHVIPPLAVAIGGVGLEFVKNSKNDTIISDIVPGGPASRNAQIERGLVLTAINTVDANEKSIEEINSLVRGPIGSSVSLALAKPSSAAASAPSSCLSSPRSAYFVAVLTREETRVMEGFLLKKGGSKGGRRNWSKRFFVMKDKELYYFKTKGNSSCKECPRSRLCANCSQHAELKGTLSVVGFEPLSKEETGYDLCFKIIGANRVLLCQGLSHDDVDNWTRYLSHAIARAN